MKSLPAIIACCLGLLARAGAAEDVVISEFMASNTRILADENGSFEDWIEISNAGFTVVNLGGWFLTDAEGDLTKWQFPATNLNAGGFLVVFASNKDRRVAGGRLHTNFRLSAGGEYLALVKPDGTTIATEFKQVNSGFPPQAPDVSYGFGVLATNETLVASNAAVRVIVPQNGNDGTNWTAIEFDDSGWTLGTNGVGFGSTNVAQADYGAAVAPTAPVGYWRLNESVGTTAVNTGSGAGLNGTYTSATVGTAGPRPPTFNGFEANNNAPTLNGSSGYVNVNNSLLSGRTAFTVGGWIKPAAAPAARTGLFGQNDCVEFGFITSTTLECWTPGGGSLTGVPYPFPLNTWHHVLAVANGSNIRIFLDGTLAGTGGSGPNYGSSTFPFNIGGGGIQDATGNFFNGQIDEVVVYHRALTTNEIRSLYLSGTTASGVSVLPFVQTDVGAAMSNVNATAYIRLPFVMANPTNVSQLTLRIRYDDGFVAYLNGAELARVNAPATPEFNSSATNAHSTLAVEEFRFGPAALVTGTNLLAIQGLNVAASDPDFLVQVEVLATHTASASDTPVYFTVPSPGAANSGGVAVPGPAILEPAHSPNVPRDADDIVVTARVLPTFNAVAGVTLRYRTMFDPEVPATMFDDGNHGDGAPGDGVFGVTIPASAGTNGQMIRWYFIATDVSGRTSRWPLFTDPANTPEYLGTIVDPTNVTSLLPIFHLFAAPGVLQTTPPTTQTGADSESGGRVAVYYDGEFYDNVYMELRGNTSAGQNKKSHRLEFNREHTFRHLPEFPRIRKTSFMAEFLDPAYLRQHLCFWLLDQMGVPSPFFYPVRAQLNGSFYALVYHNDTIDEEQVARLGYDPAGAIYKAAGNCLPSESSTGVFQKKTEPLNDHSDYQALVRAINETNVPPGQATNVSLRRIAAFDMLDIPEVINYLAGARWCAENDDVWANMSLYRDITNGHGDGLWRIIPFDMNASWGQRYGGITPLDAINDDCKSHPLYGGATIIACDGSTYNRIYDVVIAVPELRQMMLRRQRSVLDRWVLEPGVAPESRLLETHIRYMTNLIWTEAFLDRAKWGYSTWTASNKPLTNAVNELFNEFINLRRIHWSATHSMTNVAKTVGIARTNNAGIPVAQLPDAVVLIAGVEFNPSSGNQDQEYICLTNPLPYAVDLSGWQLGGGVQHTFHPGTVLPSNSVIYLSPNAVAFRARPLSPRGGQGLFVQGNYSGHLSAWGETLTLTDDTGRPVTTSSYAPAPSLAQQYLRVTEIMYNPSPLAGNTNDAQQFEYIELKNIGPSDLDLRGVRFTNGIEFAFSDGAVTNLAPGARVLVVRNPAAFTARYGGGASIAGTFAGTLDSNGETLRLDDATGERILEFAYNNSWYPITDGFGFSLVIVNENAYWDTWGDKASWRPSGSVNGAPGLDDPAPPVIAGIVINELLSHSVPPDVDVIELYNPTAGDVDIGGWFITDDPTNAFKFRIPAGTMIAAGGFKTFSEADFNPTPGTPPSFAFSSRGDEAYLFSGDANTNLTGYIYGFSFDAGETNVSFGRHVSSDGREHFVAQSANTLGTNNAAPQVGPLVFSEIMYHPSDLPGGADNSDDEFIEVRNITGTDVSLFDPGAPTNTWRLRGGVDFDFPANTNLAGAGHLLLVNFNPTNTARLAAFIAKYNVSMGVPIFGPYGGKLNNSSDTLKLYRPDAPVGGEVPYILVEAVDYKDGSPWTSAADGTGASLHRVDIATFGNDPINWLAAEPTAGAAVGGGAAPSITAQPASQNGALAFGATFSVTATGTAPLHYQWRFNGSALEGATNFTLSLSNLKLEQSGDYSVVVFNAAGSAVSSNATLTVLFPPSFYVQPASRAVHPGTNVTFTAGATGTLPLIYQWRLNAVDLAGATNSSYSLFNVQPFNAGNYTVVLSNPSGSLTSSVASLIVYTNPAIVADLTNITARAGSNVTFVIQATTSTPISYQWAFNGTNISGATNSTLLLTNVQPVREGAYSAMLVNGYGSSLSATSILSVLQTPAITQHPQSVTVLQGATVTFTVAGIGNPLPLSYRWRKNPGGITLTNMILAATNATFTIVNAQPFTNGTYTVVITNVAGASSLSSNAVLTVLADNDGDGLADDWERLYGFSTNSVADASADSDDDGMTNLQEYLAGTNPTNNLSFLKIDSIVLDSVGTNTLLTLSAVSNHTYSIICRDDVADGVWVRLADIDARATNRVVTVTNQLPVGVPNRFYRLQTPRLP